MTWFLLALLTALAAGSQDAWVKKWFSHLNAYEMLVYPLIYCLPLTFVCLLFIPVPPLDGIFWASFAASIPLNAIPYVVYMQAIKISPLSLSVPFLAFTPVFMIGTGYLFLNEIPDQWGIIGIAAVCVGSYVLNIDPKQPSIFEPFRAIWREAGSRLMLMVSFLFSFSAVIGKLAILHSSVMFFQMSFFTALSLFLAFILTIAGKIHMKTITRIPKQGMVAGLLWFLHIYFHGFAISMTKAAYMVSIKRLSILFSVIYGGMIFDEENILIRFMGALLMFSGAALIFMKAR
jgi:drug/metabolite transporter (DMT)-like permease